MSSSKTIIQLFFECNKIIFLCFHIVFKILIILSVITLTSSFFSIYISLKIYPSNIGESRLNSI